MLQKVASPLAYYLMNNWLQNFAYQVPVHASVFIIAMVSTVFIAAATITYQAIKAALANPVTALRSE